MKKIAVTITTINLPHVVEKLIDCEYGIEGMDIHVDYIIIGDLKSPENTEDFLKNLSIKKNKNIIYFDIKKQERYFSAFKALWNHIPVNSFARRNFADLFAYNEGYEIVIRIDDDNFPIDNSFFLKHASLGEEKNLDVYHTDTGWYNICLPLVEKENRVFYPRGYPYEERWHDGELKITQEVIKPSLCAGLWLGDPDVDAITRLHCPVEAVEYNFKQHNTAFALKFGTWSPINTQNTSYLTKLIPAAFVSPFSGRYDDIFSGYFLRSIMDHFGDHVIYGLPLVNQVRNEHYLWSDLEKEMFGNINVYELLSVIKGFHYKGTSYASCLIEICAHLRENHGQLALKFDNILNGMEIWGEIFI